jgi:hypothetical protein
LIIIQSDFVSVRHLPEHTGIHTAPHTSRCEEPSLVTAVGIPPGVWGGGTSAWCVHVCVPLNGFVLCCVDVYALLLLLLFLIQALESFVGGSAGDAKPFMDQLLTESLSYLRCGGGGCFRVCVFGGGDLCMCSRGAFNVHAHPFKPPQLANSMEDACAVS